MRRRRLPHSLQDLNPSQGTFGADFWIWSTCPSKDLRPLDVMDFPNSVSINTRLGVHVPTRRRLLVAVKVSGVFRHSWNMGNYPFDRHVLTIAIENTNAPASEFAYRADRAASQPSRDIALDGWRISRIRNKGADIRLRHDLRRSGVCRAEAE